MKSPETCALYVVIGPGSEHHLALDWTANCLQFRREKKERVEDLAVFSWIFAEPANNKIMSKLVDVNVREQENQPHALLSVSHASL